jgi:PAS domain S-box-containing protein
MATVPTPLERGRTATGDSFYDSLEMLCIVQFDGRVTEANASLLDTLGCAESELVGSVSLDHIHPEDQQDTLSRAAELLTGANVALYENRYRCHDGSYRWLAWSARSEPGEAQVHCAARDVTESRTHRDLVDKLLIELERSNTDLVCVRRVARSVRAASHGIKLCATAGWPLYGSA